MSQVRQIHLSDIKDWLTKETASLVEPLKTKASSMLKEINQRVDDTKESSQKILENSLNEMNKNNPKTHRFARNANKFAQSLVDTLDAVKASDNIHYEAVLRLCDELEKTCATIDQLRRNAYPYISPYFIFDRRRLDVFIKRLFDMTKELRNFLTTKYAQTKAVDEASSQVDRLVQTLSEAKRNEENLRQTEERMHSLENEITETKTKLSQAQARTELNELVKLDQRSEELRTEVKHNLRHLQKPFYKLQSLTRTSEVAVTTDEIRKLDEYLKDPLTALATEDDGYTCLRSILTKLDSAIAQNRLKLKSTRLRKAQDQISAVLNQDSLGQLQKNGQETLTRRQKLLSSETVMALQGELSGLQKQLATLQKEHEFVASRSKALKNEQVRLQERAKYLQKELERKASQLTRRNVQILLPS